MERNGSMTRDVERKTTRVLFCGTQFPGSHLYTTEYLQNHSSIKVHLCQGNVYIPTFVHPFHFDIFSAFSCVDVLTFKLPGSKKDR